MVKNLPADAGDKRDVGSIPGLGISPGGENGNLLQYSCLEDPMDRGAWQALVHGVAKSQTRLKQLTLSFSVTNWISGLGIVQFSVSSVSSSVK